MKKLDGCEENRAVRNAVVILLALWGFVLYRETFHFPWVYDDFPVIVENPDIRSIANFLENSYPGRPLREFTFLLDYRFFGLDPYWYHFQNIFWHVANGILLFLLATNLKIGRFFAAFSAFLFLTHPLNVEVVVQTSHRKDSLCVFFILLSILLWRRFALAESKRVFLLALAALSGILAVLAKESGLLVAAFWISIENSAVPAGRQILLKYRKFLPWGVAVAALLAVARILYLSVDERFLQDIHYAMVRMTDISAVNLKTYYFTALKGQAFMFSRWLWPASLAPEYSYAIPGGFFDLWVLSGVALTIAAAGLAFFSWSRAPAVSFSATLFFLGMLPTSGFFGFFSYFAADRYMYLPSTGLSILVAYLFSQLSRGKLCRFVTVLSCCLIIILSALSVRQIRFWSSNATMIERIATVSPRSFRANIDLALVEATKMFAGGERLAAVEKLKKLSENYPYHAKILTHLAGMLANLGNYPEAVTFAEKAALLDRNNAALLTDLGVYYENVGRLADAERTLQKAVQAGSRNQRAYLNLGKYYENTGALESAEKTYRQAIEAFAHYDLAFFNLGVVCYRLGKYPDAYRYFSQAAEMQPGNQDYLYNAGLLALELGQWSDTEQVVQKLEAMNSPFAGELRSALRSQRK